MRSIPFRIAAMRHAKSAYRRRANIPIPPHMEHPEWTWGSIIYRDKAGRIVGYGYFHRAAVGEVDCQVSFDPSAVELLSQSPLQTGG
jgi:hypothetical protein